MTQDFLALFRARYEAAQTAFNEGDFRSAFAGFADDVEYHPVPSLPEAEVLRGRQEVERFFTTIRETIDWRVETGEYIDAGNARMVVHVRGTSVGRLTGIESEREFYEVVEVGSDGLVVRVQDFERRSEALEAVGLTG